MNKSPLRYPGGKTRACRIIEDLLKKNTDLSEYKYIVSPFFGGGSFEFYIQNKYNIPIEANDKFSPLYIFWNTLKYEMSKLSLKVKELRPVTKEDFYLYRKRIVDTKDTKITTNIEMAGYYFAINRCSFSGSTLSGGYSKQAAEKRFTESSIQRLEKINLDNVEFYNLDYEEFLHKVYKKNKKDKHNKGLIFLDPPYYLGNKSKLYGNNGEMHMVFDHERLLLTLSNYNNWILCYNNTKYIRDLYRKYKQIPVSWSYGMNKSKESSELLILNFSE